MRGWQIALITTCSAIVAAAAAVIADRTRRAQPLYRHHR